MTVMEFIINCYATYSFAVKSVYIEWEQLRNATFPGKSVSTLK